MTIESFAAGETGAAIRAKINANAAELDTRASTAQTTAESAATAAATAQTTATAAGSAAIAAQADATQALADAAAAQATADAAAPSAGLSAVATSGAYADLSGRPTLGTAAATDATAYATAAQGVKADGAAQIAGDLAGTPAAPTVAKISGVAVSGTPSAGQVLTATSGTAAQWSPVSGDGVPSAFTSRALTDADDGDTLVCGSAQTATVNTGLGSGFGCAFKGAISFDGTATVTDVRTTGAANPWCALVQTGADTYDAVGGKA